MHESERLLGFLWGDIIRFDFFELKRIQMTAQEIDEEETLFLLNSLMLV